MLPDHPLTILYFIFLTVSHERRTSACTADHLHFLPLDGASCERLAADCTAQLLHREAPCGPRSARLGADDVDGERWFDAVQQLQRPDPSQQPAINEPEWVDAICPLTDSPALPGAVLADHHLLYDAREDTRESTGIDNPIESSEQSRTGKTPYLRSSPANLGAGRAPDRVLNMTGGELEPSLLSILEKGPKFAMMQSVTSRTLRDVEVGIERAMFALRWKFEIDSRRTTLPLCAITTRQLKPRFSDNDATVPRPAPVETERAMSTLKRKIIGLYKNHHSVKANVLPEQEEAIAKLSQDKTMIVKPSDKGKGLVVMKRETYVSKASDILQTYEQVSGNPTPKVEATTKRVIKTVMENKTDKSLVNSLLPQGSRTAEFYGLPKNHKDSVPLRPIVSACGGPLDKLTWFLEQIISQLVKHVPAHLPNTDAYLQRIKQKYTDGFPPGTILFSLDVCNLYGNIPISEAVQVVMDLLQKHKDTTNMFGLSWTDLEPLLQHCLTNSYLKFGPSYYKQNLGLPMGNRIAPSVAIIFMGALEDNFLSADRAQPAMYMRYIDDCMCVWTHGADALSSYFDYVNTVHPTIKFTIERSDASDHQGQIPFLDTVITVRPDGHFSTELFIKPAAASIILPFDSAQPFKLKKAVAKSQFLRALKVSSDPTSSKRSTDKIYSLFRSNGYPSRWLDRVVQQAVRQHTSRRSDKTPNRQTTTQTAPHRQTTTQTAQHRQTTTQATAHRQTTTQTTAQRPPQKDRIYMALPFIDDVLARRVEAKLRSVNPNLTAAWQNNNTVKKRLVRSALEPPPCRAGNKSCRTCNNGLSGRCTTKNVVYQIGCMICADSSDSSQTYIGETKRCVRYRFDEHHRDGVNRTQQTPIGEHMLQCHPNEPVPRLSITILRRCKDAADRKIAEALAIRDKRPKLNSQLDTWPLL